jgi:Uma2 family endonuclease
MTAKFSASTDDLSHRRKPWPTMYDLPSEDPEEPGLPNEFHDLQPQLLSATLQLNNYSASEMFSVSDMNLYYDHNHTNWYKRPDWMLVVGVERLYEGRDLRQSYVVWDEQVVPTLIFEFLSEGTEAEDLGRFAPNPPRSKPGKPPGKFEVYEQILQIPNYVVYDRPTEEIRYFRLINGQYQLQPVATINPRIWIPEFDLGIGIWDGTFENAPVELMRWLRWCDSAGNWVPTALERERSEKEAERIAKEFERAAKEVERAEKEAERLAKEAERAEKEAERAEKEAERAEKEAERAEKEAERAAKEQLQKQLEQSVRHFLNLGLTVAQVAQALSMTEAAVERLAAD